MSALEQYVNKQNQDQYDLATVANFLHQKFENVIKMKQNDKPFPKMSGGGTSNFGAGPFPFGFNPKQLVPNLITPGSFSDNNSCNDLGLDMFNKFSFNNKAENQ